MIESKIDSHIAMVHFKESLVIEKDLCRALEGYVQILTPLEAWGIDRDKKDMVVRIKHHNIILDVIDDNVIGIEWRKDEQEPVWQPT